MRITRTHGLIAAPFTPFDADGSVDLSAIPAYAAWLQDEGVAGAFVCGTTGEGPSLSVDERMSVAEAWTGSGTPLKVIVHVGHNSLREACRLADHATRIGAAATAAVPPFFFRPVGVAAVVRWCEELAAAAPDLPFYYYHIPSMSGVYLSMAEFIPVAAAAIPNFAGIKFTYEDLVDFSQCVGWAGDRYDILFGRDELLLSGLRCGATGAVGSTYNFAAPLYLRLIEAFNQGDPATAEALQEDAVRMINLCISGSWHPIAAFKWLMSRIGVECGPTRQPIPRLDAAQIESLSRLLGPFIQNRPCRIAATST